MHPLLEPLLTPAFHGITSKLLRHFPSNPYLTKAEGILRFFFEGKRPITEQSLPHCLAKEELDLSTV
jgi:hypothetical protein